MELFLVFVTNQNAVETIRSTQYHSDGRRSDYEASGSDVGQMRNVIGSLG